MKRSLISLLCLLVFTAGAMAAPKATMAEVLEGKIYPLTYTLRELPTKMKAVEIKQGEGTGILESLISGFAGAFGTAIGTEEDEQMMRLTMLSTAWTAGDEVEINGVTYVVTYRLAIGKQTGGMVDANKPDFSTASWRMYLINSQTISSISPNPAMTLEALLQKIQGGALHEPTAVASATMQLSNYKQLGIAIILLSSDSEDIIPYFQTQASFRGSIFPYVKNSELFKSLNPNGGRPIFNMNLAGVSMTDIDEPTSIPAIYESRAWPDGSRIVAFVDGSTRKVVADQWADIEIALKKKFRRSGKLLRPDYKADQDPLK